MKNLDESKSVTAKIHEVNVKTLISFMRRMKSIHEREKNTVILNESQTRAVHQFIRFLLIHEIQPTHEVVYSVVLSLKHAQDVKRKSSSRRWFWGWWKQTNLHKIKIKSLTTQRVETIDEKDVRDWFLFYRNELQKLKNIINFDETGFQIECMKRQKIIVSDDIKKYYAISSENRKSLTIFEMISAVDDYPPSSMMIIQGHEYMTTWFAQNMSEEIRVITSKSDFIFDVITIEYLKHYIQHSNAESNAEWKLMLMNNHDSHVTSEFILLANENRIRFFSFISHLTHIMQPLDVEIFRFYKHYHDKVLRKSVVNSFAEYSIAHFLNNLTQIRNNIFSKDTIQHAFQKSEMWSINVNKCIKKFMKYSSSFMSSAEIDIISLSRQTHPREIVDIDFALKKWGSKIRKKMQWSDLIREDEFKFFIINTKEIVSRFILQERKLQI